MNATILPDGSLKLTAGNEERARIKELAERGMDDVSILCDGTEHYWTNGGFHPFDASAANPFVGLTSAPCIAEDMSCDDDGKWEVIGRLWYFGNYMLRSPIEELKNRGRVIFQAA